MREQIEARMGQLREELQRADEELSKLRPRVGYLEQMMLRLDGALTALQGLLEEPQTTTVPTPGAPNSLPQPVTPSPTP